MSVTVHRAGWVMADPDRWIENGAVEVQDGRILSVGRARPGTASVDHGPGVIMPALGNAHTHIGLSFLKGRVDTARGFACWTRDLVRLRETVSPYEVESACEAAAASMKRSGVGFAAEVGSLEPATGAMNGNQIKGMVFLECLGSGPDYPPLPPDDHGISFSWAGHGPHTTGPEFLATLKAAARRKGKPFSIHLAESASEVEFLGTGRGEWHELMESRGHDCRRWKPWGERPVERAHRLGLLGPRTVAVHLLEAEPHEIDLLATTGTRVCVCPRSNMVLHGKLPDLEAFLKRGIAPALGTDSLASVPSLSVFHELNFMALHYPGINPKVLLGFATLNVARALGLDEPGALRRGRAAPMIYVHLRARTGTEAAEKLVSARDLQVRWLN